MGFRKRRFLFKAGLVFVILAVILLLGFFFTQSSLFRDILRKTIISQTNKQINGHIDIAGLEGNIYTDLTLQNVLLFAKNSDQNRKEIISLKQLDLSYDLRHLFQKKITINSIVISEVMLNLHQNEQGIWNLADIATASETTKSEKRGNPWKIDLESFILSNSKIDISGNDLPAQFPREISISQLISHASLGEKIQWELSKAELSIQPQNLTLSLRKLQGNEQMDFNLEKLDISFPKSQILLAGNLINHPIRQANIKFQANPLDFSELQTWLPSFPLQGEPIITGELEIQGDSLSSEITINRDKQVIILQAQLSDMNEPLTSHLKLDWKNINSNSWEKDLPDSRLNGSLTASIKGENWPEVDTKIDLKLVDSAFNSYQINTLSLDGKGSPTQFNGTLLAKSEFGAISFKADIKNLLDEIGYIISGSLKEFDFKKISPSFPYESEINSQFSLNGQGSDPKELQANFLLDLSGSYFENKPLERLSFTGKYQKGNYNLDQIEIDYDGLEFSANGQGNIYGNHELTYNLQLYALPKIIQDLQPELALKGNISGTACGSAENLVTNFSVNLKDMRYQDYQLASLTGESLVRLIEQKPEADFTGSLTKLQLRNLPIDSIWVSTHYTPEKIILDLHVDQSDSLALCLAGDILPPPMSMAHLTKIEIEAFGQNWQNKPDTLKINFNPDKLSIQNFELNSDAQIIAVNFSLNSEDNYNLKVKCDSLKLWPLRYLNPGIETVTGNLSLYIDGKGNLSDPQLSASWNLDKLLLNKIKLQKATGNLEYQNNKAQLDLLINRSGQESISLKGYLPFQADIANNEFKLLNDEPLNLDLLMSPFDLSNLNEFSGDVKEIKGVVNLSAKIENTLNHPRLNSLLLIKDAAFIIPNLGIDYRDINLDLKVQNNKFVLNQLTLPSSKKGMLKIEGSTVLNLKEAQLDSLQFSLIADKWQALKGKDMDLNLNSKIQIAGNSNYPTFSGYLNLLRARLYLPALLGREKKKEILTTPLLLVNSTNSNLPETDSPKSKKEPSQLLKNIRGNLLLSFPRNIWLKSKEMNLELGGELEIIKNSPDFLLSGSVMVVRGNYTIYGRRFNISSGNIYFQGENDLDPEIAIVANYILRSSSQEKLTLSIQITGTLKQPVIQFYLDEELISEGDGVSYIVFGKSTAELSSGERSQINNSGEDNLATKIVVSQITSRVTTALQNRLNLDVIEFKGDNNWRQAQVTVGKYLTNNLFLSYERELSFGRNNEVIPEKITLEYEIRRRIYLQATEGGEKSTGVDLIWKYQN